jgi:hypothetical protein
MPPAVPVELCDLDVALVLGDPRSNARVRFA